MKLNGKTIKLEPYAAENLDNETVIYIEESGKIVLLNDSATIILNQIYQGYSKGTDTSTDDIVACIFNIYPSLSKDELNNIYCDVKETIDLFFEASLIKEI